MEIKDNTDFEFHKYSNIFILLTKKKKGKKRAHLKTCDCLYLVLQTKEQKIVVWNSVLHFKFI